MDPRVRVGNGAASREIPPSKFGSDSMRQGPGELTNSIGIKLVLIPQRTFMMGSSLREKWALEDERQHQVTISQDYYLGIYKITQAQYERVIDKNPSYFQGVIANNQSSDFPVDSVSWDDAVEFCKRLSELPEEISAGRVYRLPTEAEWENACRAGSKTLFSYGDKATQLS